MAALVMVAAIAASCSKSPAQTDTGSSTGSSGGDNTSATIRDQAVKFAECMRDNGVGKFPDPDASGDLTIDGVANGSSIDPNTAVFKQAVSACKDLEPPGFTGHKRSAQEQEKALEFAQCMRDNGVEEFGDPTPDGPLINIDGSKPGLKAAVDAAMQTCSDFAAGGRG